jgi:TetR/AcrR family tetracycline transcriptional repressor
VQRDKSLRQAGRRHLLCPLNAERIVDEAIALMQEQGLDAVSLRRLAGRLGVQAMSIYWHIPNKEELLRRMSKQLYAEATKDMPAAQTWQDWASNYAHALWIMYHGARDAARLTFSLGYGVEEIRAFGSIWPKFCNLWGFPRPRPFNSMPPFTRL